MDEIWKKIEGYDRYEISNFGSVRSKYGKNLIYLKKQEDSRGYIWVGLRTKGKTKYNSIHKLVALHFLGKIPENMQINHMDGDSKNNKVNNLEYVSMRENINHRYALKGVSKLGTRMTKGGKFTSQIRIQGKMKHLGTFQTEQDARAAYVKAAMEQGDKKYLNGETK